jgi:P-type Cu+ transporter
MKKTFAIVGMHCAGCAGSLTKAIEKVKGVFEVHVTYSTDSTTIVYDEKIMDMDALKKAVESVGSYQIVLDNAPEHSLADDKALLLWRKMLVALSIFVVLLAGSISGLMLPQIAFLLTTVVMFYSGKEFFVNAAIGLKNKTANMDTLVAMGTGSAYIYSTVTGAMYFETAAAIVGLILLGRYLEAKAKSRAGQAIKELLKLQAKEAVVLVNGKEVKVAVAMLKLGDILVVKPGSKIPVDGVVVRGSSYVDESLVTGESKPVKKKKEDKLIGGTVNSKGRLIMKVTQVGEDTVLSKIATMVQEAQSSQAPIQKLADRVSAVFVPTVIVLAVISFVVWYFVLGADFSMALEFFITVLIISCPCALGLATPIAIMVGTGKGASMGILIKNAEKLQMAGKIDTLVFDKTGTLTKGNFVVTKVVGADASWSKKKLLKVAAGVEVASEHPIATAILEASKGMNLDKVSSFKAIEGMGVEGKLAGKKVVVGTQRLMEKNKYLMGELLSYEGTVAYVAVGGQVVGVITLADEVKNKAKETVADLQSNGIKVWMMTGDNEETAKRVASGLGVKNVLFNVLPKDKVRRVGELQSKGGVVAMVGDGVNDAPALAKADVGIAMATGTEVAMETADITLVRGKVELVSQAILLSKKTMTVIVQNLFWAFGYNVLLIPVAAGVLMPFGVRVSPILASGAMAFSSLSVVLNSLRLKKVKL